MRHKTNTRSSLFLMELIIAILFFSLASAVCLRMFAKSHQLSCDATARNQAVNQAGNVAELIKYDLSHKVHTFSEEYPDADIADGYSGAVIYFDQNWSSCDAAHSVYKLTVQGQASSSTLEKYTLTVYTGNDVLYELPLSVHIAREVDTHE